MLTNTPEDIAAAMNHHDAWVLYRLPDAGEAHLLTAPAAEPLADFSAMDCRRGWVVWPFRRDEGCKPYLIPPVRHCVFSPDRSFISIDEGRAFDTQMANEESREDYARSFAVCHEALSAGRVDKVVLARQRHRPLTAMPTGRKWVRAFVTACLRYPDNYIALWHTTETGTWMVASPETLLARQGDGSYTTMALAGTMAADGGPYRWSEKNRREQRLVAEYIRSRLTPMVEHITSSPTQTVRAGGVVHLRTDFRFSPAGETGIGSVVESLHPTPAVCGLPTEAALETIRRAESFSRRYYAGFSGPLLREGDMRLFVSLRCMELTSSPVTAHLYAGGGLLDDSRMEEEWEETCRKMLTIEEVMKTL